MFDMFDAVDVALMLAGVIVIVVGFVVLALLRRRDEDQRWEVLAVWAHDNGLKFNSKEDRSIDYRFPFFNLPKGDGDHYAFNVMEGVFAGRQIWAFDYFWLKDNGLQDFYPARYEHHWRSFIAVEVGVLLETLSMDPIRFVGKSTPLSEREKASPESGEFVRSFFLPCPNDIRLDCEFYGTQIMARGWGSGPNGRFSPTDFGGALQVLSDMLDDQLGPTAPKRNGVDAGA